MKMDVFVMMLTWMFLIVTIVAMVGANTCQTFEISDEQIGIRLDGYIVRNYTNVTLPECAKECMYVTRCKSFNFNQTLHKCQLNSEDGNGPTSANISTNSEWLLSAISTWPHAIAGSCKDRPCQENERCIPNDPYSCSLAVYGFTCTTEADCDIIGGTCKDGVCACPFGYDYDPLYSECRQVHLTGRLGCHCQNDSDCINILGICVEQACTCQDVYQSEVGVCQLFALVPSAMFPLENLFVPGSPSGVYSLWYEGAYHAVKPKFLDTGWDLNITYTACNDLIPGGYGGFVVRPFVNGSRYKIPGVTLEDPQCLPGKSYFSGCQYYVEHKNIYITLMTCYPVDILQDEYVRLSTTYVEDSARALRRIEIKYNNTWYGICGDANPNLASQKACQTIDPTKPIKRDFCDNSCAGASPDLYLIYVACYGVESHMLYCNDLERILASDCVTGEVATECDPE